MADVFSKKKRSQIMSRIAGRNTSPEKALCLVLKRFGYRPQRHRKDLPGSPDFVLKRENVVIFMNGCFWHGHKNCRRASLPATNRAFWREKISNNKRRDERQRRQLRRKGWKVLTFWTCGQISEEKLVSRFRRVGLSPKSIRKGFRDQ